MATETTRQLSFYRPKNGAIELLVNGFSPFEWVSQLWSDPLSHLDFAKQEKDIAEAKRILQTSCSNIALRIKVINEFKGGERYFLDQNGRKEVSSRVIRLTKVAAIFAVLQAESSRGCSLISAVLNDPTLVKTTNGATVVPDSEREAAHKFRNYVRSLISQTDKLIQQLSVSTNFGEHESEMDSVIKIVCSDLTTIAPSMPTCTLSAEVLALLILGQTLPYLDLICESVTVTPRAINFVNTDRVAFPKSAGFDYDQLKALVDLYEKKVLSDLFEKAGVIDIRQTTKDICGFERNGRKDTYYSYGLKSDLVSRLCTEVTEKLLQPLVEVAIETRQLAKARKKMFKFFESLLGSCVIEGSTERFNNLRPAELLLFVLFYVSQLPPKGGMVTSNDAVNPEPKNTYAELVAPNVVWAFDRPDPVLADTVLAEASAETQKYRDSFCELLASYFAAGDENVFGGCDVYTMIVGPRRIAFRVERRPRQVSDVYYAELRVDDDNDAPAFDVKMVQDMSSVTAGAIRNVQNAQGFEVSPIDEENSQYGAAFVDREETFRSLIRDWIVTTGTSIKLSIDPKRSATLSFSFGAISIKPPSDGLDYVSFGLNTRREAVGSALFAYDPVAYQDVDKLDLADLWFLFPEARKPDISQNTVILDTKTGLATSPFSDALCEMYLSRIKEKALEARPISRVVKYDVAYNRLSTMAGDKTIGGRFGELLNSLAGSSLTRALAVKVKDTIFLPSNIKHTDIPEKGLRLLMDFSTLTDTIRIHTRAVSETFRLMHQAQLQKHEEIKLDPLPDGSVPTVRTEQKHVVYARKEDADVDDFIISGIVFSIRNKNVVAANCIASKTEKSVFLTPAVKINGLIASYQTSLGKQCFIFDANGILDMVQVFRHPVTFLKENCDYRAESVTFRVLCWVYTIAHAIYMACGDVWCDSFSAKQFDYKIAKSELEECLSYLNKELLPAQNLAFYVPTVYCEYQTLKEKIEKLIEAVESVDTKKSDRAKLAKCAYAVYSALYFTLEKVSFNPYYVDWIPISVYSRGVCSALIANSYVLREPPHFICGVKLNMLNRVLVPEAVSVLSAAFQKRINWWLLAQAAASKPEVALEPIAATVVQ